MYSKSADKVRESFHESHQIENVWGIGYDGHHDPSWQCTVCESACCQWGDVGDMEDLREPCPGVPWYEADDDD